jgi:hypothetical protein
MKTMFKYSLLLLTCFAFASEECPAPRIEEKNFGPYSGYYDNLFQRYVINKGNGVFVGIENGASLSPKQAAELYDELKMLHENQILTQK